MLARRDGRARRADATFVGRPSLARQSCRKDAQTMSPDAIAAFRGASLLLFGGKGGVGKTTVAAATALRSGSGRPVANACCCCRSIRHTR